MKKTVAIVLLSVLSLMTIVGILLNTNTVQQMIARVVISDFERRTGASLTIDEVTFDWYRGFEFHLVHLKDKQNNPILSAERVDASIQPLSLLRNEVHLNRIRLVRTTLFLNRKNPREATNVQFILDAYKSGKRTSEKWSVALNSIVLIDCKLHYDLLSSPVEKGLDVNHLYFTDLSAKLAFRSLQSGQIRFSVKKLSVSEHRNFRIDQLDIDGNCNGSQVKINHFTVRTGNSEASIHDLNGTCRKSVSGKTDWSSIRFKPFILKSRIKPSDFAGFYQTLTAVKTDVFLTAQLSGSLNHLNCNNLIINAPGYLQLTSAFKVTSLLKSKTREISGTIQDLNLTTGGLHLIAGCFSAKETDLSLLSRLGELKYAGNFAFSPQNSILKGHLTTDAGQLNSDVALHYLPGELTFEGDLTSSSIRLSTVLSEKTMLGETGFNLHVDGLYSKTDGLSGTVDGVVDHLVYKGYDFKNLQLKGHYKKQQFEGLASLGDANGKLNFNGLVNFSKQQPAYHFDLKAEGFNPFAFGILGYHSDAAFSFHMRADATGRKLDDIRGQMRIDSLTLSTKEERFHLRELDLVVDKTGLRQQIRLTSPVLDADLQGEFQLSGLPNGIKGMFSRFLPALFSAEYQPPKGSNYEFHASLIPCPELFAILHIPVRLNERAELQGSYNETSGKFRFRGDIPVLMYGKKRITQAGFLLENPQKEAKLLTFAQFGEDNAPVKFNLDIRGISNLASFRFSMSNVGLQTYSGNIQGDIRFERNSDGKLNLDGLLKNSTIMVNDSLWTIHPSRLRWENNSLQINNFELTHADQFIKCQGVASKKSTDSLLVTLNSFSLDNVFELITHGGSGGVFLGGSVTGSAKFSGILGKTNLNADLFVEHFTLNKVLLGNLTARSQWDTNLKAIVMDALVQGDSVTSSGIQKRVVASGRGFYFPAADSMELHLRGNRLPLSFLEPYLGSILKKMDGLASGDLLVQGAMKRLKLSTRAYVENGSFGIDMLNTRYSFSDSILVTPKVVRFKDVRVRDKEGNVAIADGTITHNSFKNARTDIRITGTNILAMDIPPRHDAYFYGKAYGTGTVSINGPENDIVIDVNLRTEDRTNVTISFLNKNEVNNAGFVQFVQPQKKVKYEDEDMFPAGKPLTPVIQTPKNVTVNLYIEATPNAELTLITDPNSGDDIKARGSGALRCVMDKTNDLYLYGRYNILSGKYKFIYQNLLRRDFAIQDGGSITFAGNPFEAQLDVTANYTVTAQLADLLNTEDLKSLNLNRTSIPVNCVLKLNGELQHPGINLGLAYPSADDELKRRINNVINTEDMVNQQLVFLMLFGGFSTPTYSTAQSSANNNMSAVWNTGFSTLSSQVNRMVNGVLGTSNMNFNFNYRNSGYDANTAGEWGVMWSGSFFNNRLSINSNVGSRENLVNGGGNQFIGEFDANLKFKNSQKWSWKFFNKANDNRYFKSALNTQGVGILYKEDFNGLSDLLRIKPDTTQKKKTGN